MLRFTIAVATLLALSIDAHALTTNPVRGEVLGLDGERFATITGSVAYDPSELGPGAFVPIDAGRADVEVTPFTLGELSFSGGLLTLFEDDPVFDPAPALTAAPSGSEAVAWFDFTALGLTVDASPEALQLDIFTVPGTNRFDIFRAGTFEPLATGSVQVVPLPAAVWMFGAGLAGLGALRLRRRPG